MTIIDFHLSTLRLKDIGGRRSLYIRLTVLGRTVWAQWWPRAVPGARLTAGSRRD